MRRTGPAFRRARAALRAFIPGQDEPRS